MRPIWHSPVPSVHLSSQHSKVLQTHSIDSVASHWSPLECRLKQSHTHLFSLLHSVLGITSWCLATSPTKKEFVVAFFCSTFIDVDHFLSAGSFNLKVCEMMCVHCSYIHPGCSESTISTSPPLLHPSSSPPPSPPPPPPVSSPKIPPPVPHLYHLPPPERLPQTWPLVLSTGWNSSSSCSTIPLSPPCSPFDFSFFASPPTQVNLAADCSWSLTILKNDENFDENIPKHWDIAECIVVLEVHGVVKHPH